MVGTGPFRAKPRPTARDSLYSMADEARIDGIVVLFRPTGPRELALVAESGYRRWPPRLPEQPIFYPVANEAYARQIAEHWNVKASGAGFVTRFAVKRAFLERYAPQIVGASEHEEYWIPAEDLEAMNDAIVGEIEVIASFGRTPDEPIVHLLGAGRGRVGPIGLAGMVSRSAPGGLTQGSFITYFKRAFPDIPLPSLLEAGAWRRLSDGSLTDVEFERLLAPWLGATASH